MSLRKIKQNAQMLQYVIQSFYFHTTIIRHAKTQKSATHTQEEKSSQEKLTLENPHERIKWKF